jgi:uncharacterized protein (DUF58 family)
MRAIVVGRKENSDRSILINGLTLIALGLSVLVLDTWGNLFVKTFVGLFWCSFFLFLNGPRLVRTMRVLSRADAKQRDHRSLSAYKRRPSSY